MRVIALRHGVTQWNKDDRLEVWGETGHMVRAGLSTLDDR